MVQPPEARPGNNQITETLLSQAFDLHNRRSRIRWRRQFWPFRSSMRRAAAQNVQGAARHVLVVDEHVGLSRWDHCLKFPYGLFQDLDPRSAIQLLLASIGVWKRPIGNWDAQERT